MAGNNLLIEENQTTKKVGVHLLVVECLLNLYVLLGQEVGGVGGRWEEFAQLDYRWPTLSKRANST